MRQIAGCSFWLERLQQRMTDFDQSRYFTKLVGAALAAFMLTTPVSARQWWVMEGAAPLKHRTRRRLVHCPRDAASAMVKHQSSLSL